MRASSTATLSESVSSSVVSFSSILSSVFSFSRSSCLIILLLINSWDMTSYLACNSSNFLCRVSSLSSSGLDCSSSNIFTSSAVSSSFFRTLRDSFMTSLLISSVLLLLMDLFACFFVIFLLVMNHEFSHF